MTISSTVRTAGPYTGTGLVNTYPFAFKIFQASDLLAQQTDTNGNITTLVLTTNYSVTLNADQNASPGGSIVLNSNLPNGYKLILSSQVPELQGTAITNNGGFYPEVIENAFDYLTILAQQLQTELTQCMQLPLAVQGVTTTLPAPVAGKLLGWNATGTAIVNLDASGVGAGSIADVNVAANAAIQASKLQFLAPETGAVARTVQSRLQETVSVLDFGADPTGVADSTTAIQNAINAVQSLGGGIVRLSPGVFKVSSTLTISSSNVVMEGRGGNTQHDAGTNNAATTLIQWAGGASTVIDVRTPNLSTIAIQTGMGVRKLEIDGNATATTGISVTSIRKGIFEDLHVQNCVTQSYLVTTYTKASMSEAPDTQQCHFRQCGWRNIDTAPVQGAHGFVLTSAAPGTAAANTSYNQFYNCQGQSYNGEGFYMVDADNNVLTQCGANIVAPGTGYSLFVDGAYSNYFIGFGGASRIRGTASGAWQNTTSNVFLCADEANGSPYPVIDTNCSVQWHGSLYGYQILRATTGVFSGSTARTTAALAALGNYSLLLDSANQQHAILTDGTNAFDVVVDTNGYLRFRNVGGGGGFFFYGSVRFTGGTAAPTSGTWQTADLVWNTAPSVLGTSGSQYIIDHWRCVGGGTPGTWVACRTLTGT